MNESLIAGAGLCGAELTLEQFRNDVLAGLARHKKCVPCKYLYDEEGARIFEAICELEEYYPTRTEVKILRRHIREIASWIGTNVNLVELGSGASTKTRLLLDHLDHPVSYVPIDVARAQLLECSARLAQEYPGLEVAPVCADYTNDFLMPNFLEASARTVVFFPGSTIGNFEPEEAVHFLRRMAGLCGREGGLLLGVDLKKTAGVLNPAYNDARGITAKFNLNLLARANRELDADFNISCFRHDAFYNEKAGRIEMHLVSRKPQWVSITGKEFAFEQGESILTEHSYKYTPEEFRGLAARAGFRVARRWVDENRWFSVQFLVPQSCKTRFPDFKRR
jgi:dimethylhistidine N-methyltransferase